MASPCGESDERRCPFVEWANYPDAGRPRLVIGSGVDRSKRRRFKCKVCGKLSYAPPFGGVGFKEYMRVEVALALARGERIGEIASRLGVDRGTAARWAKASGAESDVGSLNASHKDSDLADGRWVRLSLDLEGAPYVVGDIDQEWFLRASLAEMAHVLNGRRGVDWEGFRGMAAKVSDKSTPLRDRKQLLKSYSDKLLATFPELRVLPWRKS